MTVLRLLFVGIFSAPLALLAQSTVPTVAQSIPAQSLAPGGDAVTIDLRNYFSVPGVTGQIVQFDTVLGRFNVELRADAAPRHVDNFLAYVRAGSYTNSFIHRSVSFDSGPVSIVQGGGYRGPIPVSEIPKFTAVPLEYALPNERGTLAAARTSDINSATSEWYFNVRDNSTILGPSNGGGYTVFGRVLGTGMSVVDAIALVQRYNAGPPFQDIPLRNYGGSGSITDAHLVTITAVREATLFPTGGGTSAVEFTVENSASSVATAFLSGSTLTVTPVSGGSATIGIRATDVNGNSADTSFLVTVASVPPSFTVQPASQTISAGTTVVFNASAVGAASYVWRHNDAVIPDVDGAVLVIRPASAQDAGSYTVTATNAFGSTTSQTATLNVVQSSPTDVGRLINLSILTRAGSGDRVLTVGAVIGPSDVTAPLPVVIRGVGPTLAQEPFNVPNVLPDPVITLFGPNETFIATNDNWGGSVEYADAFDAVGAFDLPTSSVDSALVMSAGLAPNPYTVQVTGKADASGNVIAELYDALGNARTASSPRLINVSSLTKIEPNGVLTLGFVIGGQTARTVLVRGVGPSLATFNVPDLMADPQLELFNNAQQKIGENDNWGGEFHLSTLSDDVGAFPLTGGLSQDAVILVTLAPGDYTARVRGANGAGGNVIAEVYEVP